MKTENSEFDVYKDMQARTNGEIYIGVVGPAQNGKIHLYQTIYGCVRSAAYDRGIQ